MTPAFVHDLLRTDLGVGLAVTAALLAGIVLRTAVDLAARALAPRAEEG